MKIALLGTAYPLRGGLANYNERLAKELMNRGHEVTIFTFSLQYPSLLFPGKSQYSDEPPPAGLETEACINSINPFNWIKQGNRIRKMKPDLLIMKYWIPFIAPCQGTISRLARKNNFTKTIAIIDNILPHEKRLGDKMLSKYFVNSIDALVVMSQSVMNELEQFDKTKPRVLTPHPLYDNFGKEILRESALKQLNLDPSFRYILFFGFIRKYKGLDLLISAFADERFRNKKIKLLVGGEFYVDSQFYLDLVKTHHLENDVVLHADFIPDSKVSRYFSAADLVVQPYRDATQSGVTQIAYHFNKPMVVTNMGALPEMVPHGKAGYVVNPDPKEIADAVLRFFEEAKEAEFVSNISEIKKKYEWSVLAEEIEKLKDQMN